MLQSKDTADENKSLKYSACKRFGSYKGYIERLKVEGWKEKFMLLKMIKKSRHCSIHIRQKDFKTKSIKK